MSKVVDSKGTAPKLKFSEFCGFINWKYSIQPKPVKFSFNAFPKLQRISSESGWRMYRGLWWRQMKHDINRDDVYNEVLLHIFWRKKQIVTFKTSTFLLFRFVPLFSICRIFRSLTFDSVTKWLEHRKLIIKTATTQKLNFSPALSGVRLHTVSFGIFQKHGLSIRSYWLHCSVFVRAGQRGGN